MLPIVDQYLLFIQSFFLHIKEELGHQFWRNNHMTYLKGMLYENHKHDNKNFTFILS